jgi:hypothetical protein
MCRDRRMLDPTHETRPEKIQSALEALGNEAERLLERTAQEP